MSYLTPRQVRILAAIDNCYGGLPFAMMAEFARRSAKRLQVRHLLHKHKTHAMLTNAGRRALASALARHDRIQGE